MLLKNKQTDSLVEVLDVTVLIDPSKSSVPGRIQDGQEEQDPEDFSKELLLFPSNESLPRCWVDADYQTKP